MPVAVTLRPYENDVAPLLALQDETAVFTPAPSLRELGYEPHITLAVYEDLAAPEVVAAAAKLFEGSIAIKLVFEEVRWFEGPPLTLYAAPTAAPELDAFARRLHLLIAPGRCHPHYRPGSFVPHCTLAMGIKAEGREKAIAFARRKRISLIAAFTRGEVVAFPPPRVEAQWHLPLANASEHS
ncbi:MAG: 2'-5' RNA ligase family protein [Hyphomicrobiales bacterium]|nr:2'-5' RNA ligase family protein [Hyphomicrobiales bacterium]